MKGKVKRNRLYERIAEVLKKEILNDCDPGDRLPTDEEVAKRFGVSPVTARQAKLSLMQQGLLVRRQGSGTYVAPRPDQRHIAVLMDRDISHPRMSYGKRRRALSLVKFFQKRGESVELYLGREVPWTVRYKCTCPQFIEAVQADRIRAVILVGTDEQPEWAPQLRKRGVPIIGGVDTPQLVDYRNLARDGVNYLVRQGCQKLALLGWHDDRPELSRSRPNLIRDAFIEQMNEIGLPVEDRWIRHDISPSNYGAGWSMFREIWSASHEKPDGLIIDDDILFQDALVAILQLAIAVPEQLRIVAHSNQGSGILYPPTVTRFEWDPDDFAELLGRVTLAELAGERALASVRPLAYQLIEHTTDKDEVFTV